MEEEGTGIKRVASTDREPKRQCFATKEFLIQKADGSHGATFNSKGALKLLDGKRIIQSNLQFIVDQAQRQSLEMLGKDASFREILSKGNKLQTKCSTNIYDTVFRMCIQRNPLNYSKKCYDLVDDCVIDFLQVPTLQIQEIPIEDVDEFLNSLMGLVGISLNLLHAITFGFSYLDRFYTPNYDLTQVCQKAKGIMRDLLKEVFKKDALQDLSHYNTIEQLERLAILFSRELPSKPSVPTQSCLFHEADLEAIHMRIIKRTFQIIPLTRPLRNDLTSIIFKYLI